ncbi:hypothetical protein [Streptomyces sp. NPDC001068]|uniref:hypothetical protein n=1 Tax=Streptomyces sp. NPDC001068 TaxID=3364544 RepID=UPI0036B36DA7
MTHTHVRKSGRVQAVSEEQASGETWSHAERDRSTDTRVPTDAQVWNWAESVVLSGYGPGPARFL